MCQSLNVCVINLFGDTFWFIFSRLRSCRVFHTFACSCVVDAMACCCFCCYLFHFFCFLCCCCQIWICTANGSNFHLRRHRTILSSFLPYTLTLSIFCLFFILFFFFGYTHWNKAHKKRSKKPNHIWENLFRSQISSNNLWYGPQQRQQQWRCCCCCC